MIPEIKQPTDIYALLEWGRSQMIEKQAATKGSKNVEKYQKAIDYLTELMAKTKEDWNLEQERQIVKKFSLVHKKGGISLKI